MNIFEMFASGDGQVDEANMSSLLAFLMTPEASHGYGRAFLGEFLECFQEDIKKMPFWPQITPRNRPETIREAVNAFSRVEVRLEERLPMPVRSLAIAASGASGARSRRDLDISVRLYGPDGKLNLVVGIENKIRDGAATGEMQLLDEYQWLRHAVDEEVGSDQASVPIMFIYLTPNRVEASGAYVRRQWEQLLQDGRAARGGFDIHRNVSWRSESGQHPPSISALACRMLEHELWGRINPPSSHSGLVLRSLIKFIDNDFSVASGTFGQDANGEMGVVSPEMFWESWSPGRSAVQALAERVAHSAQTALASDILATRLQRAGLIPRLRFSNTRITVFLDDATSPADISARRVPNTILRIRQDGSTTARRLHLEVERRAETSPDDLLSPLPQALREAMEIGADDRRTAYDLLLRVRVGDQDLADQPLLVDQAMSVAVGEAVGAILSRLGQ